MSRVKVNKIEARSGNNVAFEDPMQLKSVTTTQRDALSSPQAGDTVYNSTTGTIDFYSKDTNYDGKIWNFDLENKILDWPEFLCQFVVLEQYWNRPLNENVYFYRYINIIKSSVSQSIYDNFEKYVLEQQSDSNLKNNMLEYVRYHKKMDNIENFIQNNTIDVSESFSH